MCQLWPPCAANTATVRLENLIGKDVLLVERSDRVRSGHGWARRSTVPALTILAHYASYEDLADIVRQRFRNPPRHCTNSSGASWQRNHPQSSAKESIV